MGKTTYHGMYRNRPVTSTVDYIITNDSSLESIVDFCVLDLMEHSDHCPITFAFNCQNFNNSTDKQNENILNSKIIWDSSKKDDILQALSNKQFF